MRRAPSRGSLREGGNTMRTIEIRQGDITHIPCDALVNAANEGLRMGNGVCGAVFEAAGPQELQEACDKIGHCSTGSAVITDGFHSNARYIIHAVGPVWSGGRYGEPELLRGAYMASLALAEKHGCRTICFPLISAGIFGYPKELAWKEAIRACRDFLVEHPETAPDIIFAIRDTGILIQGRKILEEEAADYSA